MIAPASAPVLPKVPTLAIGLYGGSFNPPHLGHAQLARTILERALVDELFVLPVFEHPFGKELAPFADRLEMCRLAFAPLGGRVQVSDIERQLGGPSYTVRMLEAWRREQPASDLVLVVGADAIKDSAHWRDFDRVRALARLLVVPRQGEDIPEAADLPAPPRISSTEIRQRLARGESTAGLLHPAVSTYASEHALYAAGREPERKEDR